MNRESPRPRLSRAQPADLDQARASRYARASRWRRPPEIEPDGAPVCFVIWRNPGDFQGYVMRAYGVEPEGLTPMGYVVGGTLDRCRSMVPEQAKRRVFRAPDDAACIFEYWF